MDPYFKLLVSSKHSPDLRTSDTHKEIVDRYRRVRFSSQRQLTAIRGTPQSVPFFSRNFMRRMIRLYSSTKVLVLHVWARPNDG